MGGDFVDIAKGLVGLGPAGIVAGMLFYLFRDERSERKQAQAEAVQLLKDKIASDTLLTAIVTRVATKIGA